MKIFKISLLLIVFVSCNQKLNHDEDIYEIINLLSKKTIANTKLFVPPPNSKSNDSLIKYKRKLTPSYYNKSKYTIAVVPYFKNTFKSETSSIKCNEFKELYKILLTTKDTEKELLISKIKQKGDIIIPFTDNMITKGRKDFVDMGFDLLFQFSNIVFDNDKTKAAIIFSSSTSTLAGSSSLYFLKKQNGKWFISCTKLLSIS